MERRGFLKMMLSGLGAAAVAAPLGGLVSNAVRCALPLSAKMIMPPRSSFFVQAVRFYNPGVVPIVTPRLLIGNWELDTGCMVRQDSPLSFEFGPHGGYQLDPEETVAIMGPKHTVVGLSGLKISHEPLEPGPDGLTVGGHPVIMPTVYWLRV
jgi:hypothetical protein